MKLFASDFDGTFYFGNDHQDVFDENIRVVKQFQKENKFAFVTGRSIQSILCNIKDLKPDYIAGYNGGIICDSNLNILFKDKLEIDVVKIIEILKNEQVLSFSFLAQDYMFVKYYKYSIRYAKFIKKYAKSNQRKLTTNLKKVNLNEIEMATVVCLDEKQAHVVCDKILSLNMKCNAFVNRNCIDIVGMHTSKKDAVEFIRKHMNADEVYVIGDSFNDVCMIKYYQGYSLSHANIEVKKVANKIVDSVHMAIKEVMSHE